MFASLRHHNWFIWSSPWEWLNCNCYRRYLQPSVWKWLLLYDVTYLSMVYFVNMKYYTTSQVNTIKILGLSIIIMSLYMTGLCSWATHLHFVLLLMVCCCIDAS